MKNKKLLSKFMAAVMACSMVFSLGSAMNVNAQEIEYKDGLPALQQVDDATKIAELEDDFTEGLKQYAITSFDDVKMDDSGIATLATGDSYENNNMPSTATTGRYNKLTHATIHDDNDVDWYKIDVLSSEKPVSLFLTNIPSNCDYDLYLVKYDSTNGITAAYANTESGTTSEAMYGYVEAGTWYVVVQASSSVENNYSTQSYTLYMGDYYRTGQHGYVDTGLNISFGYIAVGNTTPVYRGWYTYDLTNNISIPDDALVTKIYMTDSGNGAYWLGFYKMIAAGGQGVVLGEKIGQMDLMYSYDYSSDNRYYVKQPWLIGGHIIASTNFVWKPQILIAYEFGATVQNLRFLS